MCRVTTLSEKLEQVITLQDVNVSLPAKLFSRFSFSKDLENIVFICADVEIENRTFEIHLTFSHPKTYAYASRKIFLPKTAEI